MTTDLSAYSVLGYYSTGKLDRRFDASMVRATRPGVQIRARRGISRPRARRLPTARVVGLCHEHIGGAGGLGALASLGVFTRASPLRLHAALGLRRPNSRTITTIIEIGRTIGADSGKGAEAEVWLVDPSGPTVASSHLSILPASLSVQSPIGPRALPPATTGSASARRLPRRLDRHRLAPRHRACHRRRRRFLVFERGRHRRPRDRHRRSSLPPIRRGSGRRYGLGLVGVLGT